MEGYESNKKPDAKKETAPTDFELLTSLQDYKNIKEYITNLKARGIFESTLENLKNEIATLKERYNDLDNQRFAYDAEGAEDKISIEIDFDRTSQELSLKEKTLELLSQDEDLLNATIKDLDEAIGLRAEQN
jgi:cell division protein FtsB